MCGAVPARLRSRAAWHTGRSYVGRSGAGADVVQAHMWVDIQREK